jgi:phosphatidylinositol dimannoside acyltransferase
VSGLREWAARSWLELLFWHTAHLPGVPRVLKPLVLFFAWHGSRGIREATLANARRILGEASTRRERSALGRHVLENFFECVLDFGRNRRATTEQILAKIERVDGLDRYNEVRRLGRGAILVTAHLGPFETAISSLRQREPRVHVVFQRDSMSVFERLRSEQRHRLGLLEAPIDDGLAMWARLRDALRADDVVLLQGDRIMPGQRGARVPFLHGHVELPEGPIKLARITGSPIIPTFAILTPQKKVRILIGEPILTGGSHPEAVSPDEAMQRVAASIASVVREYPDQWLNLQKTWLEDRGEMDT